MYSDTYNLDNLNNRNLINLDTSGSTVTLITSTTPLPSAMLAAPTTKTIIDNAIAGATPPDTQADAQADAATFRFSALSGITLTPDGKTLYAADAANNQLVAISLPDGAVTPLDLGAINAVPTDPLAGYTTMNGPSGLRIATDKNKTQNLYFADTYNSRIIKVTPTPAGSGTAQAIAGLLNWLYDDTTASLYALHANNFEDGPPDTALFNVPTDIAVDATGSNIYVADSENAAIRKITISGTTTTVSTLQLTYDAAPSVLYLLALAALAVARLVPSRRCFRRLVK